MSINLYTVGRLFMILNLKPLSTNFGFYFLSFSFHPISFLLTPILFIVLHYFLFVHLRACFSPPQVNPGQWSQLAMAPMVAAPSNGDPYDIPRARMGAPLAIPEVPVYHQQMPGAQIPYQGEQMSYQGVPPNPGTPYNNQFHGHHPSDPGDSRPMWVPPSPY